MHTAAAQLAAMQSWRVQASVNAVNNACWALGLLVERLPADEGAAALALPAAERLTAVLRGLASSATRRLRENAGISLGRIAALAPAELAPHLGHFLAPWCSVLATILVRLCP